MTDETTRFHLTHRLDAGERLCLHVFDRDAAWKHPLPDDVELIVGRAEFAGLRLADSAVSRAHACLSVRDGRVHITDLGSVNGVKVNGQRIPDEHALAPGDVVTLGRSTIILEDVGRRAAALLPAAELERRVARLVDEGTVVSVALLSFPSSPRAPVAEPLDVAWLAAGELLVLLPGVGAADARATADRLIDDLDHAGVTAAHATAPDDGRTLAALAARLRADPWRRTAGTVRRLAIGEETLLVADPAMARLYDLLARLAAAGLPVLVYGETGAGKEAAARYLHQASPGAAGPFVALSCAGLPDSQLDSVDLESGGTLFLDDVDELSPAQQARLLRALDATRARKSLRVISATHRDLASEMRLGRFRKDLYFRLSAASVWVPPLRERPRELALLARAFLDEAGARRGRAPRLAPSAVAAMSAYGWPGNVRELRNLCDYLAAAVTGGDVVQAGHVTPAFAALDVEPAEPAPVPPAPAVQEELRELEKQRIVAALRECGGNQTRAALLIGMPRRTFVAKVKRYGIKSR